MERWNQLVELMRELYALNKVYTESHEVALLSLIGAYLHGSTANVPEKPIKQYGIKEYAKLLEIVGDIDPITKNIIAGKVKPLMIYNNGERIDCRIHRLLLFGSSMGKGREIAVMQKILPGLGLAFDSLQKPTAALLLGRTERKVIGKSAIEYPIFPALLYNDVLILNECETLFKGKSDIYSDVPTILRNATDQYGDNIGSQLHNDSSSNTTVKPFYSRSTIIAASYPSDRIKQEIATGTLQRFFITSVSGSQEYTSKIIDAKISRSDNVEYKKSIIVSEICSIIRQQCNKILDEQKKVHEDKNNPRFWYYKYDISNSHEYVSMLEKVKERKEKLGNGIEYSSRVPFYIRGIAHMTKIACIVSIINGRTSGIGAEEAEYAMNLYFDNLRKVDTAVHLTAAPRERKADDLESLQKICYELITKQSNVVWNKSRLVEAVSTIWKKPKKKVYNDITELEKVGVLVFEKSDKNASVLRKVNR